MSDPVPAAASPHITDADIHIDACIQKLALDIATQNDRIKALNDRLNGDTFTVSRLKQDVEFIKLAGSAAFVFAAGAMYAASFISMWRR